jgi:hypothetical protein
MSSCVSCCPNLIGIDALFLQHGPDVPCQLKQLTGLTALMVRYDASGMSTLHESLKGLCVTAAGFECKVQHKHSS